MNHILGFAVESVVAALLLLTIGYCMVLNKRLKRLKADEHSLKATISELITATEIAERAIGGLKATVRDCNDNLGNQIASAAEMTERLQTQINLGNDVVRRVSRIALAGRNGAEAEVMPAPVAAQAHAAASARSIAAAAQAFAERKRATGLAA